MTGDGGDVPSARRWLDRARLSLSRAGGDPLVESYVENATYVSFMMEGKNDEARDHLKRAVVLRTELLGADHPLTLRYRANYAGQMLDSYESREAVPALTEILAAEERTLGKDSGELINVLANLGNAQVNVGQLDEAEHALERAIALGASRSADANAVAMAQLARLRVHQRRCAEGLDGAERAVEVLMKGQGAEQDNTVVALAYRGLAEECLGRHAKAIETLTYAIEGMAKAEDPMSDTLQEPLVALGRAQLALKQPDKALASAERSLAIADKTCAEPGWRGSGQLVAAKALVALKKDRPRAGVLATAARDELSQLEWLKPEADEAKTLIEANGLAAK
jgi:tetratricopeptide (TPR) repeat protein